MTSIHGKEHPLRDIFSDQFAFTIPSFQRPYAWQAEHATALINDLIAFMREASLPKDLPPYFLGSIVLIKKEGLPEAEVVDGQQRLTTLTIILAALRELVPNLKNDLTKFLYEEGNSIADTPNRYRLTLRERDASFFQEYIQHEGGIERLGKLNVESLPDSQKNIRQNAFLLLERIRELNEDERRHLAQAMILHCYLVEISTSDLESAYNVFSILNDRGLNLSHADILKAQIIGKIPQHQRSKYTTRWEDAEEDLKSDSFRQLFFFLNEIYDSNGNHRRETLLVRFRKYVYPTNEPVFRPTEFIDRIFLPHAKALGIIERAGYKNVKGAAKINYLLRHLHYLNARTGLDRYMGLYRYTGWQVPAMHFIALYMENPDIIITFLAELERLHVIVGMGTDLRVLRLQPIETYMRRITDIIEVIKNKEDLYGSQSPLQITLSEKEQFLKKLEGDMYHEPITPYLLLRLDEAFSAANEAKYDYSAISIEHVLPQNPKKGSTWLKWFPTAAKRTEYTHCLGNLVLLSREKNSEAQNYDFKEKKQKYFLSKRGTSSFALTIQVLQEEEWTPEVIERRQKMLINKIKEIWHLE